MKRIDSSALLRVSMLTILLVSLLLALGACSGSPSGSTTDTVDQTVADTSPATDSSVDESESVAAETLPEVETTAGTAAESSSDPVPETLAETRGPIETVPETVPETEPESEAETEAETEPYVPILRFAVASDTHITGTNTTEAARLRKLFEASFGYAETHADYQGMDAFVFAGDVTNNGIPSDYRALMSILENATEGKDTQVILTMGNHEWFSGDSARFVEMTGQELNQDIVIKGYHFIGMAPVPGEAYDSDTLDWLSDVVKAAAEEDPDKPIFTFQHHHLKDTVYVSHDWYTHSSDRIKSIFNRYPQVINFSGHSHAPINIPSSIWQGRFTALGTGTLSYFEMAAGMTDGAFPAGYKEAAQFYIVEVDASNHVRILPYNILTDDFFRTPANTDGEDEQLIYDIETPSKPSSFTYKDREKTAEAPYFAEDAALEILEVGANTVKLTVPAAYDAQCLYGYDMIFTSGNDTVEYRAFYDFFLEPMSAAMTYTATGLRDNTEYTLTVYPVNCFGMRGEGIGTTIKTEETVRYPYTSENPVNFVGTFTNFDSATELSRSEHTFAYGGSIGGDIFGGDWQSDASSSAACFGLADRGYEGSQALDVWSTNVDSRGLYIFATPENKNTTKFPANAYLRVWVDFTDVEFRKMNFGFLSATGGLYTTDEGDNRTDQAFYYLPEGGTEWQSFVHGNDGCFGEAQSTPVKGYKGWLAFPVKDFLYRPNTGSDGVSAGTPFNLYEFSAIYIFWDYADSASYVNKHFYLDELQLVEDYRVFEAYSAS